MIVKILGIFDIISAVLFWLFAFFHILPGNLILFVALYLLVKGLVFLIFLDIASILDIVASIVIFISLQFTLPWLVIFLIVIYLLQKGILSIV